MSDACDEEEKSTEEGAERHGEEFSRGAEDNANGAKDARDK